MRTPEGSTDSDTTQTEKLLLPMVFVSQSAAVWAEGRCSGRVVVPVNCSVTSGSQLTAEALPRRSNGVRAVVVFLCSAFVFPGARVALNAVNPVGGPFPHVSQISLRPKPPIFSIGRKILWELRLQKGLTALGATGATGLRARLRAPVAPVRSRPSS
jgi:hypothetical protein